MEAFKLKTSAFREGEKIPAKYTCDGDDISPLLEIRNAPATTKGLALIMDDPDATRGTPWDHWIMWNIDPKTQYISEDHIPNNAVQGANSWGKAKYGGPCPPKGKPAHRYVFTLYALDTLLELPQLSTKEELLRAMEKHIIAHTSIVGLYGRQ
jgi:Raf kinase inhibitor-like YbhB/YbcL family protein